jgi:two-component system, cell cycle sensor histidine kinase and response regulator CckA
MSDPARLPDRVAELEALVGERERSVEALQKAAETYRGLLNSVSEAIYVLDGDGRFLDVNDGAVRMYGRPREWLIGRSPASVSAPGKNVLSDVSAKLERALAGEAQQLDFWGLRSDGVAFLKDVRLYAGTYFGQRVVVAVAQDVTERRRADERLRESEERYRLLTETSPNSITVVDPAGTIVMANPRARAIFRHPAGAPLVGRSVFEWVAPDERVRAAESLRAVLDTGSISDVEITLQRGDGSSFCAVVNASLARDPEGRPQFVVIVSTDVTDRKQAELERLHAHKLESIGVLAGGIAHDFNNLLQGVFGYVSLARMNLDSREKAAAMLDQADRALNTSINLTGQLLTFAKGGKPRKKRLTLSPVIEDAARFALSGARSNLACDLDERLWRADADEGQIAQVVQNIVLNASEAMPEGGTVRVSARNCVVPAGTKAALPEGGPFVRIVVEDRGVGIQEQHLSRIFDPYFTTKQTGSGLGLATSYSVVRNHGGAIEVASELGRGSTFSVYLPATKPGGDREVDDASAAIVWKGRVLVMDDEELVRSVAVRMVESLGHEVVGASDGQEAVEKLEEAKRSGRPFDVVILDLTVKGGMGGEEAARRIREIDPAVKAVVSSGYADNQVVANFAAHGFAAALNKPYRLDRLRHCLDACRPG